MQEKQTKKRKKPLSKNLQVIKLQGDSKSISPLIKNPIRVTKISDAKRLLSRLIFKLQTGEITGQTAKDMTYLLISYVNIHKDIEFEKRLILMEEKIGK